MLDVFTTIIGSLMGLSFLPQTWKIFKLKKSEEVSLFTFAFFAFGTCTWIAYGVSVEDYVIVIANTCGFIGSMSVLITAIYYRKHA